MRWQFGVLAPRPWLAAAGLSDTSVTGSADAWHLTFDEAVPREFDVVAGVGELCGGTRAVTLELPGGEDVEPLRGGEASRLVRRRRPMSASVRLSVAVTDAPFRLLRLRIVTENTADPPHSGAPRTEALRTSLVATHSLLGVRGGSFLSLLDPPAWAAVAAKDCRNVHTSRCWPGTRTTGT